MATALYYAPGLDRSLTYDAAESVGFFVLADSPVEALTTQRSFNNHPLFSFLENLIVQVTGRSDEWILRLLPIGCAAAAVGLLVWAVARWLGPVPGVVAGLVLATNPMFTELSRDVRGYSLMILLAVGSTIVHLALMAHDSERARAGYVALSTAALLTHLFVAPVLLAHAVDAWRRGRLDRRVGAIWVATGALALVFYLRMIDDLIAAGEERGRIFRPDFPVDLVREMTGHEWPAVALLIGVGAVGMVRLSRDRFATVATGVFLSVSVVAWLLGPENLAPRFFLWSVPAVAVAVAVGAQDRARLALPATALACAISVAGHVPSYAESVNRYPDVAAIVERSTASGLDVCVTDLSVPPLLAYTTAFRPVTEPGRLAECEVVAITEPLLDRRFVDAADGFEHRLDLDARDPAVVFSRQPLPPPGGGRRPA